MTQTPTTHALLPIEPATYEQTIQALEDAASRYYVGIDSGLTDAEYDQLLDALEEFEKEHPDLVIDHGLFTAVAAGQGVGDVPHPTPMLSLVKVKTEDDITKFLARVVEAGGGSRNGMVSVQPKLDGLAIRAVYRDGALTQVVTRGDGQAGEDVTDRVRRPNVTIAGLPWESKGSFEVRGELVMSADDFAISNANRIAAGKTGFANPRNAAAGTVRAETLDYDVQMTFVTYEHDGTAPEAGIIFADTLPGAKDILAHHPNAVARAVEEFGAQRATYPYPTDGAVIKAIGAGVRYKLGAGSRAPKWAVAYKYEAQTGETVIRDIVVEVGRTGNLSFTAVFDPVLVDGSTISRASLHNTSLIAEKDIRIGSKAIVYKANDIIPQVLSVTNDDSTVPWTAPTEDADGFPYIQRGKFLTSTNPADSVSALITYAASRDVLDIDGLGRAVADALVEADVVRDLADLFTVVPAEAAALAGYTLGDGGRIGADRMAKIVEGIESAKSQPLNRIITALGIRLTGRTFGRRLASHFGSLEALAAASIDDLLAVEGVGPERATVIRAGLDHNADVIRRLIEAGVTSEVQQASSTLPLSGMSVVVSGALTGSLAGLNRTQAQELIESLGGKASSSVSKTTSLLVTNETTTSKAKKATDLGVRIVSPEEFAEMIGR